MEWAQCRSIAGISLCWSENRNVRADKGHDYGPPGPWTKPNRFLENTGGIHFGRRGDLGRQPHRRREGALAGSGPPAPRAAHVYGDSRLLPEDIGGGRCARPMGWRVPKHNPVFDFQCSADVHLRPVQGDRCAINRPGREGDFHLLRGGAGLCLRLDVLHFAGGRDQNPRHGDQSKRSDWRADAVSNVEE